MQGSHVHSLIVSKQMHLPHRIIQNRSLSFANDNMSSSSTYSFELPYLGPVFFGKSPLNLKSFQKPLRELYVSYYREHSHDQRRIIISDSDMLIYESSQTAKSKCAFVCAKLESIVNIQVLKLSVLNNNTENQQMQVAFLPIGCEYQERFRSLYSTTNKSQYNFLAKRSLCQPSLLLFVLRKAGVTGSCSLLDCHVFAVHRESRAFELCDMIRKLIIKTTISPLLPKKETLVRKQNNNKEKPKKHSEQDRLTPTISQQTMSDRQNNDLMSNVNLIDVVRSTTNTLHNPLSSSSLLINNVQHSSPFHDTSLVLTMNNDVHRTSSPCSTSSSKQRHFIKASSSVIQDESDEIVNDLMNIVATEQLKSQASIKRHASFEQTASSNDCTMNKKRYFQSKKRLLNPIPTANITPQQQKIPPMLDGHLLRPHIVLNRYGDIGNYVPKFLRENITTRSSDSNENIFFRSTNGQLINGFLKLDFLSTKSVHGNNTNNSNNDSNHYQSTPCLNHGENIYSLVRQLKKNQTKSFTNICQHDSNIPHQMLDIETNRNDDDYRVPHLLKPIGDVRNDHRIHSFTSTTNPHQHHLNINNSPSTAKRATSFLNADSALPADYRQFLRHTDQGAYLYGEEKRQQITLEHSLGYLP